MKVQTYSLRDAVFDRSPGQEADIFTSNLVDERHGGPVTIGYGRWGPGQELVETMAVDDVMIVLKGGFLINVDGNAWEVGAGSFIYMPKGEKVTIAATGEGAITAYVTYPHWREAR